MSQFSRILKNGIIALILGCFALTSTALSAQESAQLADQDISFPSASVSVQSEFDTTAPVIVPDENNPDLGHVLFPSLATDGNIPNPVDVVYEHGQIVAVQSPDGTVRQDISQLKNLGLQRLSTGATLQDIAQNLGPAIEEVLTASMEVMIDTQDRSSVSIHTRKILREPAATPRVRRVANPAVNQLKEQAVQAAVGGAKIAVHGWKTFRAVGKFFKYVGGTIVVVTDLTAVTVLTKYAVWLLGAYASNGMLTGHFETTIYELVTIGAFDALALLTGGLIVSKTVRGAVRSALKSLWDRIRGSGDPKASVVVVEEVATPQEKQVLRRVRKAQCATKVGEVSS